jgi:hypothetical protein
MVKLQMNVPVKRLRIQYTLTRFTKQFIMPWVLIRKPIILLKKDLSILHQMDPVKQ